MIRNYIDKKQFWQYVNTKLKGRVHSAHVLSIITIFFDELIKELGVSLIAKIGNFGKFQYKQMQPRRYFDIGAQEIKISKSNKVIRFLLFKKIKRFLIKRLDVDKTFSKDNVIVKSTKKI